MTDTAIIGGTGFERLAGFEVERREVVETRYGDPSAPPVFGRIAGRALVFLPRHGANHTIPPHRVNYRANIRALKELGIKQIIAFAAVGGISAAFTPGAVVIPDQIIDYTWGRAHTFFDSVGFDGAPDTPASVASSPTASSPTASSHIDFTRPYSEAVRARIIAAAKKGGVDLVVGAVYAATQGPRLETAAEIDRMERDGADIVGMTAMPEAALAREAGIEYAAIAIVVNPAAGRGERDIDWAEITQHLKSGAKKGMTLLANL